ncbi:MAG: hypothetical protein ABIO85_07585 [Sphingomicrobium sp.]
MKFRSLSALALSFTAAAGCSAPKISPPSLAPRPSEAIDPRLPVERALVVAPVAVGLRGRLAELLAEARSGEAAFRAALGPAQRAAGAAGPARSEGWIAAQMALSALEAARAPTPRALSEIDALAGADIKAHGGIGAEDLAAVAAAAGEVGALDVAQRQTIGALSARIGS